MTLIVVAVVTWLLLNVLFVVGMTYLSRRDLDVAQGVDRSAALPARRTVLVHDHLLDGVGGPDASSRTAQSA